MQLVKIPSKGALQVNGYLLISEGVAVLQGRPVLENGNVVLEQHPVLERHAVLIDCPCDCGHILKTANENNAQIKKILLTHGHYDHIESLYDLADRTNAEVYIHEEDIPKLSDPKKNLSAYAGLVAPFPTMAINFDVNFLADGVTVTLDEMSINVLHTPGHSVGSVCYIIEDMMFTGDTLFRLNVGRTDFPDGDYGVLKSSLKKIAEYKGGYDNYKVFPGHGEKSDLAFEKRNNEYMR